MGREIRKIPADWEHPRWRDNAIQYDHQRGAYHPLFDDDYETVAAQWMVDFDSWRAGTHPSLKHTSAKYFWEYEGVPDPDYYRERSWTTEEATHYQMYETVSEGAPVSPVFATLKELADYLVVNGDYWDQKRGDGGWSRAAADGFTGSGWAPSMMVVIAPPGAEIFMRRDGMPD